jgi:hypothetical protein
MNAQTYSRRGPRGCQGTLDKSFIHANSSEFPLLKLSAVFQSKPAMVVVFGQSLLSARSGGEFARQSRPTAEPQLFAANGKGLFQSEMLETKRSVSGGCFPSQLSST